ncbi:hypothetical protein V7S43_006824 [Phytophthora oleae]|uniref:Uncharacterized protein n=1 Tax=Phytophthora oleae TaxID=2107226 RepID=A0ABD3FNH0_9STRA
MYMYAAAAAVATRRVDQQLPLHQQGLKMPSARLIVLARITSQLMARRAQSSAASTIKRSEQSMLREHCAASSWAAVISIHLKVRPKHQLEHAAILQAAQLHRVVLATCSTWRHLNNVKPRILSWPKMTWNVFERHSAPPFGSPRQSRWCAVQPPRKGDIVWYVPTRTDIVADISVAARAHPEMKQCCRKAAFQESARRPGRCGPPSRSQRHTHREIAFVTSITTSFTVRVRAPTTRELVDIEALTSR